MLKRKDSQESNIQRLSNTPVDEPLKYIPIEFDFSEWDNIPSVITKFCINLDRYMKSTINFME